VELKYAPMRPPVTFHVVIKAVAIIVIATTKSVARTVQNGKYLYFGDPSTGNVIEFLGPGDSLKEDNESKQQQQLTDDEKSSEDLAVEYDEWYESHKPSFLVEPQRIPRVVEFYAPWCPHCKHYKPHYVELANEVRSASNIKFYAIACTVHHKICEEFNVSGFPTIKGLKSGSNETIELAQNEMSAEYLSQKLGIAFTPIDNGINSEQRVETTSEKRKPLPSQPKNHGIGEISYRNAQILSDAKLSFDFALKQGIFMSIGSLGDERATHFSEWIALLHQSLPLSWNIHDLIYDILVDMDEVVKDENNLLRLVNKHKEKGKVGTLPKWSISCSHGMDGDGYTCGLWELFHVMTVGLSERMLLGHEIDSDFSTSRAADVLRNYVASFFGCSECQKHFLSMYDSCSFDRCSRLTNDIPFDVSPLEHWRELPLWLWEVHNDVNVRLMKEKAKRDGRTVSHMDEIAVQWPSREECGLCWRDDSSWDSVTVYSFLRHSYWPGATMDASQFGRKISAVYHFDDDDSKQISGFISLEYIPFILLLVGSIFTVVIRARDFKQKGMHKKLDL